MWTLEFCGWFLPLTKQIVCYVPRYRLDDFYRVGGVSKITKWRSFAEAKKAADAVSSADPYRRSGKGPFPIMKVKRV
mgnify:CR=1 FL=1